MPLRIGTGSGSAVPKDILVWATPVQSVHVGTTTGAVEIWRRSVDGLDGFTAITTTTQITVPTWATTVDVVAIGAGGSGSGGKLINTWGLGGRPGTWTSGTLPVSTSEKITITIGVGGPSNSTGTPTTVSVSAGTITGPPGPETGVQYGSGDGIGAPSYTAFGATFPGSNTVGGMNDGAAPGGGGGGGSAGLVDWKPGKPGGRGQAWIRFRSY